jgi:hypothetical protein
MLYICSHCPVYVCAAPGPWPLAPGPGAGQLYRVWPWAWQQVTGPASKASVGSRAPERSPPSCPGSQDLLVELRGRGCNNAWLREWRETSPVRVRSIAHAMPQSHWLHTYIPWSPVQYCVYCVPHAAPHVDMRAWDELCRRREAFEAHHPASVIKASSSRIRLAQCHFPEFSELHFRNATRICTPSGRGKQSRSIKPHGSQFNLTSWSIFPCF